MHRPKNFPGQDVLEDLKRERHLTALWEMWIPAQNNKLFGNRVNFSLPFQMDVYIFELFFDQLHEGISTYLFMCGSKYWISPSFTYLRKSLILEYVWHKVETLCQQPPSITHTSGWPVTTTVRGQNKLIHPLSYIVPPEGGTKEGKGMRGMWRHTQKVVRERRLSQTYRERPFLYVHFFEKVINKKNWWAHKSPFLSPDCLLKILPAFNKNINQIFELSLRTIRPWVRPDLMSPVLFSFFFLLLIDVSL